MSVTKDRNGASSFIIMDSMNRHGAITVREVDSNATYHVVDYADAQTRERLASLTEGSKVRMKLGRAGVRANVWTATKLAAGTGEPVTVNA